MKKRHIVDDPQYTIRYTDERDEPFLRSCLLNQEIMKGFSFSDEPEAEEMIKIWMAYSRYKCGLTALFDQKPIGFGTLFLMPYVKLIHHCMAYVVVDPIYHKQGVGTSLVKNLEHLAFKYFRLERLQYEIFGQNPLISILKKQGYSQLFVQEKYIKQEDSYYPRTILEKVKET